MSDSPSDQPKQKTEKGTEIPIPKRGEFLRNLKKVAKPAKDSTTDRPKK
jgi:hypothetical protein